VVTLGSRKVLCINEAINKQETPLQRINTLCKKIRKQASDKLKKCPYFESATEPSLSFAYLVIFGYNEINHHSLFL